ncbi:MAG: hypothetical protein CMH74_02335 [Nitrospina sp.]|nr:hypothetical protein [Nitrospina sp.]MDC0207036.1 hypothetical protein [Nitrospinota bacterium]
MENNPADLIDIDYAKISNRSRKFRQAGYGFFVLNLIYLGVAMFFIPPFNLGLTALLSLVAFILLLGLFTYYLLKEKKRLAKILAIIYGARSGFTAYSLITGETFQAVPFFLPCLIITFYLLGRAGWDWP